MTFRLFLGLLIAAALFPVVIALYSVLFYVLIGAAVVGLAFFTINRRRSKP
jgi:dolichol kinase